MAAHATAQLTFAPNRRPTATGPLLSASLERSGTSRISAAGHQPSLTTGSFLAFQLTLLASLETGG